MLADDPGIVGRHAVAKNDESEKNIEGVKGQKCGIVHVSFDALLALRILERFFERDPNQRWNERGKQKDYGAQEDPTRNVTDGFAKFNTETCLFLLE